MSFIFGSLLERSTTPALSPPLPPLSPLAFAALCLLTFAALSPFAFTALSLPQPFSSPAPPLPVSRRWCGRSYLRADGFPANLKTFDADPSSPATTMSQPPQATSRRGSVSPTITRTTTSFPTELSPTWTPNALSLLGHQMCYIFMSLWIREICFDSSSLIDWLWIWWMDFVDPSLFEEIIANKWSYMNCWSSFSCSWCYNFCTINSWKASRMLAYFNSAMLWMYQIDSYALDLLAYINSAMLWMYQIDNYALDLLACFNSDGHIMSVGIASQWFIM
jgi:hypothetical protein